MQVMLATPKEYGLRVAGHSIMIVTAANKQRYAVQYQVGYAGEGKIQTVLFRDKANLEQNAVITDTFIESLGPGTHDPRRPGTGGIANGELWSRVAGRAVADYLRHLTFPPENYEIQGDRLADYIEDRLRSGELTEWNVFLAMGDQKEVELAGRTIQSVKRTPREDRLSTSRFIVRSILNRLDEAIDLSEEEFAEALLQTNDERIREGLAETEKPSGPSIREVRGRRPQNGLLLIYPINPENAEVDTNRPLIGVVVSFPQSETALRQLYIQNVVKQREQSG
jgi:hypothetical protein